VNNRRKTKSAAAQLFMQPAYAMKLPIGDKKKSDILDLVRKITFPNVIVLFL
jgi:hypothetical protein